MTVKHNFGLLHCGLYYPEQKTVVLGIEQNLIEFDFEKMEIARNIKAKEQVYHIEKVNDDTFLTGEFQGYLELIHKKDLSWLSRLQHKKVISIN